MEHGAGTPADSNIPRLENLKRDDCGIEQIPQFMIQEPRALDATRLYAAAAAQRERLSLSRPPRNDQRWRAQLAETRTTLGDASFEAAWSEGAQWEFEEAVRRALARPTADS